MGKKLGLTIALSAAALAGCAGYHDSPPFSPQSLERMQKEQAAGAPAPDYAPLPTTLPALPDPDKAQRPYYPPEPVRSPDPVKPMRLQEIIHKTALNNLDARVAGYQAAIDEARILEAIANFDPTYFATYQFQDQFPQGLNPSLNPTEVLSHQLQTGFRKPLWSGGQVELRYQSTFSEYDESPFIFNPDTQERDIWDNQLVMQITQPLLRDFGTEVNRARVTIARNDQKISQLEFQNEVQKQLFAAEEAYWNLYRAYRRLQIEQELLQNTDEMLDVLIKRQPADVTRVQVSQARATLEQRAALIIEARTDVETLSDRLKRLMNDPDTPIASPTVIIPADEPVVQPVHFVLAEQIETALQHRVELMQQSLRIDSARTVVGAARNNQLPQFNIVGQLGLQGLAEDSYNDSFSNMASADVVSSAIGFQFEIPIGNRQALAIYQRTMLQLQQALDQYRLLGQDVALQVKDAQRQVVSSWESLVQARKAVYAAEDALLAINQRQEAGEALTPTFVQLKLDRQGLLAAARQTEAAALAAYNLSIARLEAAKGTLLRYNNVVLKEAKGPMFVEVVPEKRK